MARKFVKRAYLLINGKQVNCESVSPTSSIDGHGVVSTMNNADTAEGYLGGNKTYEITAEIPVPFGGIDVDIDQLFEDRELFATHIELEDGTVESYYDCQLSSVSKSSSATDAYKYSVTMMALSFARDA